MRIAIAMLVAMLVISSTFAQLPGPKTVTEDCKNSAGYICGNCTRFTQTTTTLSNNVLRITGKCDTCSVGKIKADNITVTTPDSKTVQINYGETCYSAVVAGLIASVAAVVAMLN